MVPAANNMNSVFYAENYHPIQVGSIDGTDTAPHDNAVYRAMIASSTGLYDPIGDPKAEGEPYCTVFVGRLSRNTTEETLLEAMNKYGRVKSLRLVRHIVTGASRGYAFVEYETEKEMRRAFEVAHNSIIDGNEVMVDYNRQRLMPGWIPRRLGGGLGGRKESGQLRFGGRDRPFRAPLRPIPHEDLKKLGIPLPPEGRYLSRFQLPPLPKRRSGSPVGNYARQGSHQPHISLHHLELILPETRVTSESVDLKSAPKHRDTSKMASINAAPVLKGDLHSKKILEAEKTTPENVKGMDHKRHRSRQEGKGKEDRVLEKEQRILYSQQSRRHHLSRSTIREESK